MTMRFDLPEQKKLTHEMVIPIRWGDMDAMGHVNNTIYFRYFEIVRIEWFDSIGCRPDPKRRRAGDRQRLLQLHPASSSTRATCWRSTYVANAGSHQLRHLHDAGAHRCSPA